jgi:hypothetical protein
MACTVATVANGSNPALAQARCTRTLCTWVEMMTRAHPSGNAWSPIAASNNPVQAFPLMYSDEAREFHLKIATIGQ